MTKNQEIDLLQKMIVEAREKKAGYLYDTLMELAVYFENGIRSDFSGQLMTRRMIDAAKQAREDRDEKQKEMHAAESRVRQAKKELESLEHQKSLVERGLDKLRRHALNLASVADVV